VSFPSFLIISEDDPHNVLTCIYKILGLTARLHEKLEQFLRCIYLNNPLQPPKQKAPAAWLFCPGALTLLSSPYRNDGPSLQMVPLLGRSLVPPGWTCQFRAAEVSDAGSVQARSNRNQGRSRAKRIASSICCILSANRTAMRPLIVFWSAKYDPLAY